MNLIELERGEDIISKLPNHVLSHILSRLETKDAVKTSILSSRWKDLWTLIYNLHFKYLDNSKDVRSSSFENFVDKVLSRCQSHEIQDFFIFFHFSDDTGILSRVAPWICFAIEHKVQSLEINAFYNTLDEWLPIRLPQSIVTCKTLVKLNLSSWDCDFVFDIPDSVVCFPSLKILHLEAHHSNGNLLQKFFRSCPVLEELTIHVLIKHNENVLTFDITVPTLKTLEIHLKYNWEAERGPIHKFVVRARNLKRLYIDDDTFPSFVMDETPYISHASLSLGDCLAFFNMLTHYEPSKDEASRAMALLRAIKSTKFLSLSEGVMRILLLAFDGNLPTFPNLIRLEAGIDANFGWKLLPHFLNNSPNLEALSLNKEFKAGINTSFELENVPSCLLLHVEKIEMINMTGYFDELEVMRYLLKNSKVLKSFLVGCSKYAHPNTMNQIYAFPRGSDLCKVELY